ncbi:MAG: hypothetical protein DRQ02_05515, partial [Candidatus Latescibacterota bacterium]
MTKQTKLTEKAARIPDTREVQWEEIIPSYLHEVQLLNTESARSHRFAVLVQQLLGLVPNFIDSYSAGIEKYLKVKQKDRILKGKADNLFGNVVIEFEAALPKKRNEAEEQLRRYVAILWSQESSQFADHTPYICIATDGVRFVAYSPSLAGSTKEDITPEDVGLEVIEEADWTKLSPSEIYYWLDRYFLRKEILHPTSEEIVRDFGLKSHAFRTTTRTLLTLWRQLRAQSAFAVIYENWEKYLRIVYGSLIASDQLFARHTYLATLAKLMAWKRMTESRNLPDAPEIVEMLEGRLFKKQGIDNFIEEDFFSWLAREGAVEVGVGTVRWLFSLLQNYNLRELSEDVLKSLYQELVDPETRHDLGEFYTPDWLAHRIVRKLLGTNPRGKVLDPACGSGTFLYLAIREKRERLGDSSQTLSHILDSVYGADIHPLAVIVAKTNYILALGEVLKRRKVSVTIPIYLADTVKLPEPEIKPTFWMQLPSYRVELGGHQLYLPDPLLANLTLYDQAIELAKDFAQENREKEITLEAFCNYLQVRHFPEVGNQPLVQALFAIAEVLKNFIDTDRDTIWAFVLKNMYKPLFFKRQFDFVVGNPPWIAFRFMEPAYQSFLKQQITQKYRLLTGRGELITHLEVATLFLVRSADMYLKKGGMIAFVLPRSLFSADQHHGLRQRSFKFSEDTKQSLLWREVWDCEGVTPLFNVPACVLIAEKRETAKMEYPVAGQILTGRLDRKNASLEEAEGGLEIEEVEFALHTRGRRSYWAIGEATEGQAASYYKKRFAEGATIVPRSFWFVQVQPSLLGFNPDLPPLESAARARREAKAAYKSVYLKGTVESRFLYATLLSTDLLPFGHLDYRLVVLPIEPEGDHYNLSDAHEARRRGFLNLARWLENVEHEWAKRRSAKAEQMTAIEWLDYRRKLTGRDPESKYRVVYPDVNRIMLACVVHSTEEIDINIGEQQVHAVAFATDYTTYGMETNSRDEAFFVCTTLNSSLIDHCLEPWRRRGQKAHPHVVKKIFDVAPIPQFDAANPMHRRLAELGEQCSTKVAQWLAGGGRGKTTSIGKLRGMVRE